MRSCRNIRSKLGGQGFNRFYRSTRKERDCATNSNKCSDYESVRCDYTCIYAQQMKKEELVARDNSFGNINF